MRWTTIFSDLNLWLDRVMINYYKRSINVKEKKKDGNKLEVEICQQNILFQPRREFMEGTKTLD